MILLVPETKMVDVGELINLGNQLVRKVTWFVLTTTSATLILSRTFGADCMTRIACIYSRLPGTHSLTFWLTEITHTLILLDFDFQRQHSLSLSLSPSLFISTSRNSLTMPVCKTQFNTRNIGAYTFCNLFLSCSAFLVRLFPVSNTASEISSNPERDKQQTWEKTHSYKDILLDFCISIPL